MPKEQNPSPPQRQPKESEEASSTASAPASGSDFGFVEDTGPAFDPDAAPQEPPTPPPAEEPALAIQWEEDAIGGLLATKGRLLHAVIGVSEEDWLYTELDLAAIAPPLTRIFNRYEPIARYAAFGDPILVASAMGAYAARSALERRYALADAAPAPTETDIPPAADLPAVPASEAPSPQTPPRQAAAFPTPPAAPAPAPPPPPPPGQPRPGEAPVDPAAVDWSVEG